MQTGKMYILRKCQNEERPKKRGIENGDIYWSDRRWGDMFSQRERIRKRLPNECICTGISGTWKGGCRTEEECINPRCMDVIERLRRSDQGVWKPWAVYFAEMGDGIFNAHSVHTILLRFSRKERNISRSKEKQNSKKKKSLCHYKKTRKKSAGKYLRRIFQNILLHYCQSSWLFPFLKIWPRRWTATSPMLSQPPHPPTLLFLLLLLLFVNKIFVGVNGSNSINFIPLPDEDVHNKWLIKGISIKRNSDNINDLIGLRDMAFTIFINQRNMDSFFAT